jgi:hypothetical protein
MGGGLISKDSGSEFKEGGYGMDQEEMSAGVYPEAL